MPLIKEKGAEKGLTHAVIALFEELAVIRQSQNELAQSLDQMADILLNLAAVGEKQAKMTDKIRKIMGDDKDTSIAGGQV